MGTALEAKGFTISVSPRFKSKIFQQFKGQKNGRMRMPEIKLQIPW